MIDVTNLIVGYDGFPVVESLTFHVPAGGCVGLLGRSGSGKTTVLHAIAGLVPPESGTIRIDGRIAGIGGIQGIVFQEVALLGWRTVLENVCFPGTQKYVQAQHRGAEQLLQVLGLGDFLGRYPHELSTGMRRRVEFARALLLDERYLIADEPFGALDLWTRQIIWRWFRDFRNQFKRTTLIATHSPEEAMFLCEEVIVLSHKRPSRDARHILIPRQWTTEEIMQREELEIRRVFAEIVDALEEEPGR